MVDFDVVIYDDVSAPVDMKAPQGGSETGLGLLVQGLVNQGVRVGMWRQGQHEWSCKTLIISRYSQDPKHIHAGRTVVLPTDFEHQQYTHLRQYPFAFVSEWQRKQFPHDDRDRVIYPTVQPEYYQWTEPKKPGRWIYASAVMKGLDATLKNWLAYRPQGAKELVVTTTGYDEPLPGFCEAYQAKWLGKFAPKDLALQIARAEGMYYVNVYPECFPIVVALAKIFRCKLAIACSGHPVCGIQEATEGRDLTPATIIPQWLEFLKL